MRRRKQNTTLATVVLLSLSVAYAGCGSRSQASLPQPGGDPTPLLGSLSPVSVIAGGQGFALTVSGSNFASSTTVDWNGQTVPTTFVNNQQVTAAISLSLIASAGFASVRAQNGNSSLSNALQFRVNNPAPQITSLSPDKAMAGAAALLLTVSGSNFVSGATLLVDGSARPVASQTATQLQTTIPAGDLAAARSMAVAVANPEPAAGPSNQIAFTITPFTKNPSPTLISASDKSVPEGWPGFELTVNGSNFVTSSVLQWDGLNRPTTVVSSSELKAAIPSDQLASPGATPISVFNPSPGGGTSSPLSVDVRAVPSGAVGVMERSSVGPDFAEPNGTSECAAVSRDGRFVVFRSYASNLVPGDTDSASDVFLRDTCIGAPPSCVPSVVKLPLSGYRPAISGNGRFVAVGSGPNISLYDTCFGGPAGCVPGARPMEALPDTDKGQVSLSGDGRFAVFLSGQLGCSPWDYGCSEPNVLQVLLADTCSGVSSGCTPGSRSIAPKGAVVTDALQAHPSISPDGRFVAFNTSDSDLWLFDSCRGGPASCSPSTVMVSMAGDGGSGDADSFAGVASAGGRYVAFLSRATNLVPDIPGPGVLRVYLRDMCTGAPSGCVPVTTSVSVAGDGTTFADDPSISADGRYIAFASGAADLVPGDTNGALDVFLRDTCAGVSSACAPSTVRVSVALDGTQGNDSSFRPMISADGRFVVFLSAAKLGPGNPNASLPDVYLARH